MCSRLVAKTLLVPACVQLGPCPEILESRQGIPVPRAACSALALDDVVERAHGKLFDSDAAAPGVVKVLDAVGREYEIDVEGAVSQLHEVLPAGDLVRGFGIDRETEPDKCVD